MPDINDFIKIFDNYCDGFLKKTTSANTHENIQLKITHSKNVFYHCSEIAKSEKLSKEQQYVAEICGLFHDIGRFEQFTVYNTFRDDYSVYHGALGVEVLKKEKFLEKLSEDIQEIILTAVYNHGLIEIPKNTKADKLYFSKLVRDADKADIFRIVAHYYHSTGPRNIALEYGLEDIPVISPEVFRQFCDRQMISKENLKTLNDFKTMQLAWIFDINFSYTTEFIIRNQYLDTVMSSITDERYKDKMNQIIKEKLYV
ncbi:MAG TPA: HD domain-containing protein [Bacteroidales bacterium]|nr:HD domain-containing protein [Bacteroidales bacterium]